eukprot:207672_1
MSKSPRSPEIVTDRFKVGAGCFTLLTSVSAFIIITLWLNDTSHPKGGFKTRAQCVSNDTNCDGYWNWHPMMMSACFVLLLPFGISSFELYPFMRKYNKHIHGVVNTMGVICACVGFSIIIDIHKTLDSRVLCQSVHALCGYVVFGCLCLEYCVGFILYVLKLGGALRGSLKPLHKRFGFYTMIFGLATVCMGIVSHTKDHEPAKNIITMQFAAILIGFVMFGFISNV